jgi:2-polyprenyl-3-methyl-5-hydroxy-6-metoxy-1,4-benzoquinol methylase
MPAASHYILKSDRYSSHAQIAHWLLVYRATLCRECTVLDVGCARGFLGHWLAAPDFYLMGIDNSVEYLADLHPNYQQKILADIESDVALSLDRVPDVLVLADVLEHCRYPESVLQNLCRRYVPSGTRVIISLPNVAHLHVRWSLLRGRFDYAERGILDRTHLRSFTLRSAAAFCRQNDLVIDETRVTPTPLPLVSPLFAEGRALSGLQTLNGRLTRVFKTLLGYQFIFFARYAPPKVGRD